MSPKNATLPPPPSLSPDELDQLTLDTVQKLLTGYEPGVDRVITPENVYQPARPAGREHVLAMMDRVLLPGSRFEGLEHLDHCLGELEAGRSVLFLPEHRGNMDAYTFDVLLRREEPKYHPILDRLIFIAGRKLNESSDLVKMFSEKFPRLVIVPRRDYPLEQEGESAEETAEREEYVGYASRINRSAFRQLMRLRKQGHIFILYPLGGRLKPDADNHPVPETISYLERFDTAYPISMEGNTLPPREKMEEERPIQDKVIFRVGPPLDTGSFLSAMKNHYDQAVSSGDIPDSTLFEQHTVEAIMTMLERLRLTGGYGDLNIAI